MFLLFLPADAVGRRSIRQGKKKYGRTAAVGGQY